MEFEKTAVVIERKAACQKYKAVFIIGSIIGSVLILSGAIVFLQSQH
jgi:uncharacterized membrane protein YesL